MSLSAFEYIVEIESKSRGDILARRPFSFLLPGYGKIERTAMKPFSHCHEAGKKAAEPKCHREASFLL